MEYLKGKHRFVTWGPGSLRAGVVLCLGLTILALAAFLFAGCGSDSPETSSTGQVTIGLTDNDGDFVTYTVDVTSITLTKANGTVVDTLPLSTRVDFAQYTEMTEFLTAATIPSGAYVKATMIVDYRNADIQVEVNNNAVPADVVDENGDPLTTLEISVQLANARKLVIAPGIPAHMTLDFDLEASHTVDLSNDPPVVTVEPVLIADVNPEHPKEHCLRGLLESVDTSANTFVLAVRPFFRFDGRFGSITVTTDEETVYEIDRQGYTGSDGLMALANMDKDTAVLVHGTLACNPFRFMADEVYAGTSLPIGMFDMVRGNVIARNGNDLTVRGATIVRTNGVMVFNDNIIVTVGSATKVTKQATAGMFTTDDISVGQRLIAFGTINGTTVDDQILDATAGHVRMLFTTLQGQVVEVNSGLVVNVSSIDRRRIALFDFSGTGATQGDDADPANYEINTGSLDLTGINGMDPIRIKGFVTPFGTAPADFEARTLVSPAAVTSNMAIHWQPPGTAAPFATISADMLELDLDPTELGALHHVGQAGIVIDLLDLQQPVTVQPQVNGVGLYVIRFKHGLQVYCSFENFANNLNLLLDGTNTMKHFYGRGTFDNAAAAMTANTIAVKIK